VVSTWRDWDGGLEKAARQLINKHAHTSTQQPLAPLFELIQTNGRSRGAEPIAVEYFIYQHLKNERVTEIPLQKYQELLDSAITNAMPYLSNMIAQDERFQVNVPGNDAILGLLNRMLLEDSTRRFNEIQSSTEAEDEAQRTGWYVGDEIDRYNQRLSAKLEQRQDYFIGKRLHQTMSFIVEHQVPEQLGSLLRRWVTNNARRVSQEYSGLAQLISSMAFLREEQQELMQLEADASVEMDKIELMSSIEMQQRWEAQVPFLISVYAAALEMSEKNRPVLPDNASKRHRSESAKYVAQLQRLFINPSVQQIRELSSELLELRSIQLLRKLSLSHQ
jgi:hypothetical protein